MAKYMVSTEGIAGPYLAVEKQDIDKTEKLLKEMKILHIKSSDIKDGNTGDIIFRIYTIGYDRIDEVNLELAKNFPPED